MVEHLCSRGVMLLEPPLGPERRAPAERTELRLLHEGSKVTRVTDAIHEPGRLRVRFEYSVRGSDRSDDFCEEHTILTLPLAFYVAALEDAGLSVEHDRGWPSGPGLLVGRRS